MHGRENVVVLGIGAIVLVFASLVAHAELSSAEVGVFRAVTELPGELETVIGSDRRAVGKPNC